MEPFLINKLIIIINITIGLGLIFLIYFGDKNKKVNYFFIFSVLCIILWSVFNYFADIEKDITAALFYRRMVFGIFSLFFIGAYSFAKYFPVEDKKFKSRVLDALIYLFSIVFSYISIFTSLIVENVKLIETGNDIIKGKFTDLFFVLLIFPTLAVVFLLVRKYFYLSKEDKSKIVYFLIGIIAFSFINLISSIIPTIIYGTYRYHFIGDTSIVIFLAFTAYAIVKRELFGVKVFLVSLFVGLIAISLFIDLFVFTTRFDLKIMKSFILMTFLYFGYYLVKSVLKEIEQKEQLIILNNQLDKVNFDLKDLNENLQEKVDEQTVEIRRAYDVEKKARQDLAELDESKTQFILATEHHLRTPLTIVKGYVGTLLEKKSSSLDEESKSYLTKANDATLRITDLVNELLEISQMEVGKSILKLESVNIKDLIIDVINGFKFDMDAKQIKTVLSFPETPEENTLNLNKEKMTEAVSNLISNAVKYNKMEGEIKVSGKIITKEENKEFYEFSIEDQGIGIKPENLSKIFTQYFERGAEARKVYATGRGIGLVIAKNIIKAHNGTVRAESEGEGKGSRLVVELPM